MPSKFCIGCFREIESQEAFGNQNTIKAVVPLKSGDYQIELHAVCEQQLCVQCWNEIMSVIGSKFVSKKKIKRK